MSAIAADKGIYAEPRYVSQEVFDIHLQGMRDRAASEERITDTRFERLEAVMDKTLMEIKVSNAQLRDEIKQEIGDIKLDNMKFRDEIRQEIGGLREDIIDIRGDVKALGASVQSFQHRRGWDIAWTGIVIGAVIGLIQMFTTR